MYWRTGVLLTLVLSAGVASAETAQPARLAPQSLVLDGAQADDALVVVGERGHILRSTNSGTSWQQVIVPTRALLTAVFFVDGQTGWVVGQDATILATSDGGLTWQQQFHTSQLPEDDLARDAPLLDISCISVSVCAASGAYGLLLLTQDGGLTWQRTYVKEDDRNFYVVHMFSVQHMLVAGESGAVMESQDGGQEWTAHSTPYGGSFFGFAVLPNGDWMLHGLRGHVLLWNYTSKGWQEVPSGVDTGLMGSRVLADGRVVIVGAGGAVLTSSDNARSFTVQRRPDRAALAGVVAAGDRLLLLGEKGIQLLEDADAQ